MGTKRGEARAWATAAAKFQGAECHPWPYCKRENGYGSLIVQGKMTTAHRHVCELAHGKPPPLSEAAHSCGNRACCNPAHLRWASHVENMADRIVHGTSNHGERNGRCKLTREAALLIRVEYATGSVTHLELAQKYGVSRAMIGLIVNKKKWRHLEVANG